MTPLAPILGGLAGMLALAFLQRREAKKRRAWSDDPDLVLVVEFPNFVVGLLNWISVVGGACSLGFIAILYFLRPGGDTLFMPLVIVVACVIALVTEVIVRSRPFMVYIHRNHLEICRGHWLFTAFEKIASDDLALCTSKSNMQIKVSREASVEILSVPTRKRVKFVRKNAIVSWERESNDSELQRLAIELAATTDKANWI